MRLVPRARLRLARFTTVAPMIDLVFLLIFLFSVVGRLGEAWALLARSGGIDDFRLPWARSAAPDECAGCPLVIYVRADGAVFVGGERRSDQWLRDCFRIEARLSRALDGYAGCRIVIKADERAEFRHIQKIFDLCREPATRIWPLDFGTRASRDSVGEEGPP